MIDTGSQVVNPDLKSEESLNVEGGLLWDHTSPLFELQVETTLYRNWVDEWVIWLPNDRSIWSPDNIRKVQVSGLEFNSNVKYNLDNHGHSLVLTTNYAFTESINESGLVENDNSVGKQLPYVPKHQFNIGLTWTYHSWSARFQNNFTGSRFATDDNASFSQIDAFNLVDLKVGKDFKMTYLKINTSFQLRNLFDVYYENLINRAMPGRNYSLNLLLTI